jgi:DNA polymerase-4
MLTPSDDAPRQLVLGEPEHGRRDAEQAMDRAIRRFGPGAVQPATLIRPLGFAGSRVPRILKAAPMYVQEVISNVF